MLLVTSGGNSQARTLPGKPGEDAGNPTEYKCSVIASVKRTRIGPDRCIKTLSASVSDQQIDVHECMQHKMRSLVGDVVEEVRGVPRLLVQDPAAEGAPGQNNAR